MASSHLDSFAVITGSCERCGDSPIFHVGGTTLDLVNKNYCKQCIRLLDSFPGLYYKIRFTTFFTMERGDARLVEWLQYDHDQDQATQ